MRKKLLRAGVGSLLPLLLLLMLTISNGCAQIKPLPAPTESRGTTFYFDNQTARFYNAWQGTPYLWSGTTKRGIDCSALMQLLFSKVYNIQLPRTTAEQLLHGRHITRKELRPGDLIFFKTGCRSRHVGMYLGRNHFLHVSKKKGVTISELSPSPTNRSRYWDRRFWCARRVLMMREDLTQDRS